MKILVIGGNLFFGKKLTELLISAGNQVTLLNRGNNKDNFGDRVSRIKCDRNDTEKMRDLLGNTKWDVVFDQVCYDYQTARSSCEIFKGKTSHYIFTSSQSVYDAGANISESSFQPEHHKFQKEESVNSNYAEAKRQAEVGFTKHATFPISYIRFPIVIGDDDYTKRFEFHINRIRNGQEIFFESLKAKISFISSDDAAKSLLHIANNKIFGAINCCNDSYIPLERLVELIEEKTQSKVILAKEQSDTNSSPYGIGQDWYMDSSKLKESGLNLVSVEDMISEILKSFV
ncbi:MAG: NAD-dependent dehydratase [Halobacteriovorax sp.]|nr:NAD-dependent dehydratase [Halobacteriovorax sp.]